MHEEFLIGRMRKCICHLNQSMPFHVTWENAFALLNHTERHGGFFIGCHVCFSPNCGAPCYAFDLELIPLESPWQGCVHSGHFINFQPTEKRLLNLKWFYHWKSIKIYKIKFFNAKSLHHSYIWGHICFFISHEEMHEEFFIGHIRKCICLFMSHEKMHLLF
jgi:hypothetical protein